MSLFYPDVVIGRPGARCDALEAQNMIVCIPGARRCYQRAWRVDLGCGIYVHNLRDCAKMGEMLRALLFALHTSQYPLHTPCLVSITYHLSPRAPCLTPITSHSLPHTSSVTPHTPCLERQPVSPSARQPVSPSQQTIALANMPFSPVPKARGRGRRWIWGPCK